MKKSKENKWHKEYVHIVTMPKVEKRKLEKQKKNSGNGSVGNLCLPPQLLTGRLGIQYHS